MSAESLFPSTPEHWRVVTLGELADSAGGGIQTGPFGSQLHAKDYVDDGIPSIMPKNISVDTVLTDDIARVSPEDIERLAKYKVQTGDIVYSRRGDVEKCVRITPREDGWLCGTGCLRVRVPPAEVSPEYLHAYLCHPQVREWIVRHAVGATMPNLNTSILSALPVAVPSKPEMDAISSLWLTFSDKIQLNHQINKTLEQIAQAIFKSWFVDFEPVKAKIAARERWYALQAGNEPASHVCYAGELDGQPLDVDLDTYMKLAAMQAISGKSAEQLAQMQVEQPEEYAELCTTAELFPSSMQDSELGEIPEGWIVSNVDKVTSLIIDHRGKTPKKLGGDWSKNGHTVLSAKHIKGGKVVNREQLRFVDGVLYQKWMKDEVMSGDVLLTSEGPMGEMYYIASDKKYCLSQRLYALRANDELLSSSYFYFWLNSSLARSDMEGRATGTTVVGIRQSELRKVKVLLPSYDITFRYHEIAQSLLEAAYKYVEQAESLAGTRDTLLPKLLSGELTLPNTEQSQSELQDVTHV